MSSQLCMQYELFYPLIYISENLEVKDYVVSKLSRKLAENDKRGI